LTCVAGHYEYHLMTNNSLSGLSAQQLRRAANLKEKIEALEGQLSQLLRDSIPVKPASPPKRRMSRAGRARISAAAKARWVKSRANKKG
jgi:hypothetical protein